MAQVWCLRLMMPNTNKYPPPQNNPPKQQLHLLNVNSELSWSLQKPMKDFIFAVDDARRWHEENISRNRSHYSAVASLGSAAVTFLQVQCISIFLFSHVAPCSSALMSVTHVPQSRTILVLTYITILMFEWWTRYAPSLHSSVSVFVDSNSPRFLFVERR